MRRSDQHRGFALLTTLWLLAALAVVAGAALGTARMGVGASRNRLLLARAEWAREACIEILLGRYRADAALAGVDTTELGRGTWCRASVADPAARLNLNLASPAELRALLGSDSLADALLDWRDPDDVPRPAGAESAWYAAGGERRPRNGPLADVQELALVRGFDSATVARLATLLTTRGTGTVSLATAPAEVLATLPGLGAEAINLVMQRRRVGRPIATMDELASLLSEAGRAALMREYMTLVTRTAAQTPQLVATAEGGVRGSALRARATLVLVPLPERMAVVRREVE